MKIRNISFVCTLALSLFACHKQKDQGSEDPNNHLSAADSSFMIRASYGNEAEIGAGQIASTKAMRDSVKMFGQMMVTDHSAAETSLDSIANRFHVGIPHEPDSAHKAMAQMLTGLSGQAFDSTYINVQVQDHQSTVDLFQKELDSGFNRTVIDYATQYLPKIKMHLSMADSLKMAE